MLDAALDKCAEDEKVKITGRADGMTSEEFTNYLLGCI